MVHFLHIGMPKAASTWLQDAFFGTHPELSVLGSTSAPPALHRAWVKEVRRLVLASDLHCDPQAFAAVARELSTELQRRLQAGGRPARLTGLSHEVLAGAWPTGHNGRFTADALHRCFPDAKILLLLREQRSMLESSYKEFVRQGGTGSFRRFLLDPAATHGYLHDDRPRDSNTVHFFRYRRLVSEYLERFGPTRVHVGCMEQLKEDPDGFVRDLCAFLGVEHHAPELRRTNTQLSATALRLLRRSNHLFSTTYHRRYGAMWGTRLLARLAARDDPGRWRANPDLVVHHTSSRMQRALANGLRRLDPVLRRLPAGRAFRFDGLPDDLQGWLVDLYATDNTELAQLVPLDLSRYGYAMTDASPAAGRMREPAGV